MTGRTNYRQAAASEFAARIKALGFRVFLAERGEYGFITDAEGSRVLAFSFSDGGNLSGNYGPASRESGTGWRMDETPQSLLTADNVKRALYAHPPAWCVRGWKHFTTLKQHLAMYGTSSRYAEIDDE